MANMQKTAIVTGASQGIGAALVEAFLKRGYSVVANSRSIAKANPFPASPNLALVDGDIGEPKTAAKIVDTAISRFGRVDVLISLPLGTPRRAGSHFRGWRLERLLMQGVRQRNARVHEDASRLN
jgi:NAD(P)-dependent dehydrogenase (short-subunit alcohol dehydrogenase family)